MRQVTDDLFCQNVLCFVEREQSALAKELKRNQGVQEQQATTEATASGQKYYQRNVSQKKGDFYGTAPASSMPEEHMWKGQGSVTLPVIESSPSVAQEIYREQMADPNATEFYPCIDATEEGEHDLWADAIDPFLARSRPTSADAAHIEAADIQRIQLEEHATLRYPTLPPRRRRFSIWHLIVGSMIVLALGALVVDGLLLCFALQNVQRTSTEQDKQSTLALSANIASFGQTISLQLAHFAPSSSVVLTRDSRKTLLTTTHSTSLTIDASGQASATFIVSRFWGGGSHLIVAEDVVAHEIASALLQVNDADLSQVVPSAPLMNISPLNLNFSLIQKQTNPGRQVFTITNRGGSALLWQSAISTLASWITITPTSGSVLPGSTSQVTVRVATTHVTPGTYTGQIILNGSTVRHVPIAGNPQKLTLNVGVQPPCSLTQPSAKALLFTGSAVNANPVAQTVTFRATGSCAWPLHWATSVSPVAPWLALAPTSGLLTSSLPEGTITANVDLSNLNPGTYSTAVTMSAIDAMGVPVQDSAQTFVVTLTIQQPCTLQLLPIGGLVFSAAQSTSPASQTVTVNTVGSCASGVAWTASTDPASRAWLSLSANSGLASGNGSAIVVTVTPSNLPPHTYTGQITISAGNNGVVLQNSPQTLHVTFSITGQSVGQRSSSRFVRY